MNVEAPSQKTKHGEFLADYPRTGKDTPAGKLLRHYWHPVCLSEDLKDLPYPVRMLGEDLVAFRKPSGEPGLLLRRCPHRCASLEYGQIHPHGLKCSYHGWTFDSDGTCTEMPLEPEDSPMCKEVRQTWYPVQDWAGVVWGYFGEDRETPPPLPKLDILSREDGEIVLERGDVRNYNYLNFMENFADMGHVYVLHMLAPGVVPDDVAPYCDMSVNTEWRSIQHANFETSYGMKSVLVHPTDNADRKYVNTWSICFPYTYRFGGISAGLPPDFTDDRRESGGMLRIIDDESFEIIRFTLLREGNFKSTFYPRAHANARGLAEGTTGIGEKKEYDNRKYSGWEGLPPVEDLVLQESQGVIPERQHENLGSSDTGVALLRRIFRKGLAAIEKGRMPKSIEADSDGVVRTDTFKGFLSPEEIVLGAENLPSSENGAGLIRDEAGALVFTK